MTTPTMSSFPLDHLPDSADLLSVEAEVVSIDGREALRVALTPQTAAGVPDVDYIDQPTFVVLPVDFRNGRIDTDIRSGRGSDAPEYARGFAGIAYRVSDDAHQFESAYLRPTNGRKVNPPAPRDMRAVQYFSYPDWKYERLRNEFPDGGFEAGADIAPDEWINFSIEVAENRVAVTVDGERVLELEDTMTPASSGRVALWVDIGTVAYFSNLVVTPAS
jgi:hypothetical protein